MLRLPQLGLIFIRVTEKNRGLFLEEYAAIIIPPIQAFFNPGYPKFGRGDHHSCDEHTKHDIIANYVLELEFWG